MTTIARPPLGSSLPQTSFRQKDLKRQDFNRRNIFSVWMLVALLLILVLVFVAASKIWSWITRNRVQAPAPEVALQPAGELVEEETSSWSPPFSHSFSEGR